MYLNSTAAKTVGSEDGESAFDFSSLANESEFSPNTVEDARSFLRTVARLFKLPPSFVEDSLYLIINRNSYVDAVPIPPPGHAMMSCIKERDIAVPKYYDSNLVGRNILPGEAWQKMRAPAENYINEAVAAIEHGSGETAAAKYMQVVEAIGSRKVLF